MRCPACETAVEGHFQACRFCQLNREQKEFIELFIKSRGNIKEVERELGVSYPTVRSRLEAVIEALGYRSQPVVEPGSAQRRKDVLDSLARGELTAEEAARLLRQA